MLTTMNKPDFIKSKVSVIILNTEAELLSILNTWDGNLYKVMIM